MNSDVAYFLKTNIKDLSDDQIKKIPILTAYNINVVIKDQDFTKKELAKLYSLWGQNPKRKIWYEDKENHEVMYVTNKHKIGKEKRQGVFANGELGWHCNGALALDPEDCVALYCHEPTKDPCNTVFSNGVLTYKTLPKDVKDQIKDTFLILGYGEKNFQRLKLDYLVKTKIQPRLLSDTIPYEVNNDKVSLDEHKEMLAMSTRTRSKNSSVVKEMMKLKSRFSDPKGLWNCAYKKLVHQHRLTGIEGLYFPFTNVVGFSDIPKDEWQELSNFLEKHYLKSVYSHFWEEGDIVVFDQTQGLHRRDNIPLDENSIPQERELWRGAFWYDGIV